MDKCTGYASSPDGSPDCAELTMISDEEINQCTQSEVVPENTHGCKQFLSVTLSF